MTIPIIPGPFSALGQGLQQGLSAYNAEKDQQYERANAGARLILGLVQSGMLDPTQQFANQDFQQQLATAKIPVPPQGAVVPSAAAERQRIIAQRGAQAEPGSVQQDVLFNIPGEGEISQTRLQTALNNFKLAAAQNPALARMMTDLVPADIAQGREAAARASIAPKEYDYAAENFVSQAGLKMPTSPSGQPDFAALAANAKALAAADPQYKDLVANGQLSDEYFARAARGWQRLSEEDRIKYADIAARRLAAEREARYYYGVQDKSYDTDIQRLQATIAENKPQPFDMLYAGSVAQKIQANPGVDPRTFLAPEEFAYYQRVAAREQAQAEIQRLQGERADLRDRSIQSRNPIVPGQTVVPPSGAAAKSRRGGITNPSGAKPSGAETAAPPLSDNVIKVRAALDAGQITEADVQASTLISDAEKAQILNGRPTRKNPPRK